MKKQQTIKDYLQEKNIPLKERNGELEVKCIFNGCDDDSRPNESHLYFSAETGQYDCKKCNEKGNLITLMRHFGDKPEKQNKVRSIRSFSSDLVHKYHSELPDRIRTYLNNRGITDEIINEYKLGYGTFHKKNFITIPIKNKEGYQYLKLRQDPEQGKDKITHAKKKSKAQLFGKFAPEDKDLIICEGELDALALISLGYNAVSSTHGAGTFKEEWINSDIKQAKKVYVCFDNDDTGKHSVMKVLEKLEKHGIREIYHITLPEDVGNAGDITDYLTKLKYPVTDLFTKYAARYPARIDGSQFNPLSPDDLANILDLTIKKDRENKIVTFLCLLSAYTDNSQFNLSFNSPSSTGKSYIALETSKLFPKNDVIKLGKCSRTAFFHEQGIYDQENNEIVIDLARKILIFTDMPHTGLLEDLRSFLSHDEKKMISKITDKNSGGGNQTKTVALIGYPSVVFCSAGLKMDEQEMTRFILLSPEINQEKIKAGISNTINKEIDNEEYMKWLDTNPGRKSLKLRIQAIKQECIDEVNIEDKDLIEKHFLGEKNQKKVKPRHQRDIKRLLSIIKCFALLNLWWREREGSTITANKEDIRNGLALWDRISESQEHNIPPHIFNIYKKVIVSLWNEKKDRVVSSGAPEAYFGLTRQEIYKKHYEVFNSHLDSNQLRQQILPMLETCGLIRQEATGNDRRNKFVFPGGYKSEELKAIGSQKGRNSIQ